MALMIPEHSIPKTKGIAWGNNPCLVYVSAKFTPQYLTFTSILSSRGGKGNFFTYNNEVFIINAKMV